MSENLSRPRLVQRHEVRWVASQWADITGDSTVSAPEIERRLLWWCGANPAGEGALAVVEEADAVLGVAGFCPKRLQVGGGDMLIAEVGHTMTAPAARGRGIFGELIRFLEGVASERGISLMYGTPNASSGKPYVERLGFIPLWYWRRWLRPLDGMSGAVASAVASSGRLRSRGVVAIRAASVLDLEPLVHDVEWGTPHLSRSIDFLRWRYPEDRYETYSLTCHDEPVGWAITGETHRRGSAALSLADFAFGSRGTAVASQAIERLVAVARQPHHRNAFTMTRPGSVYERALARAGFVPRRSEWQLIAKPIGSRSATPELLSELAFRAGDSDTV